MWMVDPKVLCRKHLLGEHLELHMMKAHLKLGRKIDGFVAHNCVQPKSIGVRHKALAAEMVSRGYKHASPLQQPTIAAHQHPEAKVDAVASLVDLLNRCEECAERHAAKVVSIGYLDTKK